jgi:hypothetical protein
MSRKPTSRILSPAGKRQLMREGAALRGTDVYSSARGDQCEAGIPDDLRREAYALQSASNNLFAQCYDALKPYRDERGHMSPEQIENSKHIQAVLTGVIKSLDGRSTEAVSNTVFKVFYTGDEDKARQIASAVRNVIDRGKALLEINPSDHNSETIAHMISAYNASRAVYDSLAHNESIAPSRG